MCVCICMCVCVCVKRVHQQQGALQSTVRERWFGNKGGLAVHKCNEHKLHDPTEHVQIPAVENRLHCFIYERSLTDLVILRDTNVWHRDHCQLNINIELFSVQYVIIGSIAKVEYVAVYKCQPAERMS